MKNIQPHYCDSFTNDAASAMVMQNYDEASNCQIFHTESGMKKVRMNKFLSYCS